MALALIAYLFLCRLLRILGYRDTSFPGPSACCSSTFSFPYKEYAKR